MATALESSIVAPLDRFIRGCFPDELTEDRPEMAARLRELAPDGLVDAWLAGSEGRGPASGAEKPSRWYSDGRRREQGIFLTPGPLAGAMAEAADPSPGGHVVDPAAGDGRLLAAVVERGPEVSVLGIERQPELVLAAAARIAGTRAELGTGILDADRVVLGDGLEAAPEGLARDGAPDAVVMNPPYVGEKGNRELFQGIARRHPDLAERIGARGDLAYLFLHRALDWLEPGGRLVALTSSYWLTATGAAGLREAIAARTEPTLMVRAPGLRLFDDAPGHHSLLSVFRRSDLEGTSDREPEREPVAATLEGEPDEWADLIERLRRPHGSEAAAGDRREPEAAYLEVNRPDAGAFSGPRWTPFVGDRRQKWAARLRDKGTPLGELVDDRQGFVSGADRLSARRYNSLTDPPSDLEVGDPLFLWRRDELPEHLEKLRGTVVRPVLRGSEFAAGDVVVEAPDELWVLYIDGELGDDQRKVVEHLEPVREALEQRREVRRGRMPWYRLHWPRSRAEQTMPKLVVPRRARRPKFALDLSASAVSSDCTYLVAPEDVDAPVAYLSRLMVALNRDATGEYLRRFGKTKGEMIEFYSDPLRSLPLPLRRDGGTLRWEENLLSSAGIDALEGRVADVRPTE